MVNQRKKQPREHQKNGKSDACKGKHSQNTQGNHTIQQQNE